MVALTNEAQTLLSFGILWEVLCQNLFLVELDIELCYHNVD